MPKANQQSASASNSKRIRTAKRKGGCLQGIVGQKPFNQNCPKCGTNDIHRQHRMPGKEVRLSIGERSECKPRLPYLDSDWPYGWKTKSEHIAHYCRVCGHEWECDVLPNAEPSEVANVLPQLVERLKQMQEAIPQNPRLALVWELKEAVNNALELAENVTAHPNS